MLQRQSVELAYLSMRITAELVQKSPQYTNQQNQRQLDLRAYQLSIVQNMAATLNFFQCIDLSDNEIRKLQNFSYLDRLTTLIAANNRIKGLDDISGSLPNLENLFIMNNKISELGEVAKLSNCNKLQRLVLTNNPITQLPSYRLFVIAKIPSLKILDFRKVTVKERRQAFAEFQDDERVVKK